MSNLLPSQKTPFTKNEDIKTEWLLIDASGQTLGRVASQIAHLLRGKHRPDFAPHQLIGDQVIVINAGQISVTGKKMDQKVYYAHSLYPGGLKTATLREKMDREPEFALKMAVKRMLPKGALGRKMFSRLRVYGSDKHEHTAQKPRPIEVKYK